MMETGEGATNVIPDSVRLGGTLRALTYEHFDRSIARTIQVPSL